MLNYLKDSPSGNQISPNFYEDVDIQIDKEYL